MIGYILAANREVVLIAPQAARQRAPRRSWPLSEKRRLVELTLHQGASVSAIARAHGIHATSLFAWRKLYAVGKLAASTPRAAYERCRSEATLLPVTIAPTDSVAERASALSVPSRRAEILELTFSCGTTLRIESDILDTTMVCALVTQVQR